LSCLHFGILLRLVRNSTLELRPENWTPQNWIFFLFFRSKFRRAKQKYLRTAGAVSAVLRLDTDRQFADRQVADRQVADRQVANRQVADRQVADRQVT
jgi:hypothetical protein